MITKGSKVAVITRVDLLIDRPKRVLRMGMLLDQAVADADDRLGAALAALVCEYGSDELAENPERYGLVGGDSSTALLQPAAAEDPWLDTFPVAVVSGEVLAQVDQGLVLEVAEHLAEDA